MNPKEIKELARRKPFRPFHVRLNNGSSYEFAEEWQIGATGDGNILVHFDKDTAIRIDASAVVEIIEVSQSGADQLKEFLKRRSNKAQE